MGNRPQERDSFSNMDFPMQKYVATGIPPEAVLSIKQAFDSYEPIDGYISVQKVKDQAK